MRSAIYTANTTSTTLTTGSTVPVGNIIRRFGNNVESDGTIITIQGAGYYKVSANVSVAPSVAGTVTISLYKDGIAVPGATATAITSDATEVVTLPITALVRNTCCCESAMTIVMTGGTSVVSNVSVLVEKE